MSLSKASPFLSSAPSMYIQSSPKPGTDSVPFYMDFGSNSERFGRFTVSQISRNGQLHAEPTFQVFRKDNSGTFEKYQQLRIGDYEFQIFCFFKEDLLNGELEMREKQPQFDKNIGMEHVLEQCHKVREISIGQNRRLYVTFLQNLKDNPASTYVQIRLFCQKENNEFKQVT